MSNYLIAFLFLLILSGPQVIRSNSVIGVGDTCVEDWVPAEMLVSDSSELNVKGDPKVIDSPYGRALLFNGINDGLIVNKMPLAGLDRFTVEAIIRPDSAGKFEQRFLHIGEIRGDRMLMELRSTPDGWYFDAFVQSGDQVKALICPKLLHPFRQWAHVAFVVGRGTLITYINGKKELECQLLVPPLSGEGKTSIGVRQNEQSWFKGAVYRVRVTGKCLVPEDFMAFHRAF